MIAPISRVLPPPQTTACLACCLLTQSPKSSPHWHSLGPGDLCILHAPTRTNVFVILFCKLKSLKSSIKTYIYSLSDTPIACILPLLLTPSLAHSLSLSGTYMYTFFSKSFKSKLRISCPVTSKLVTMCFPRQRHSLTWPQCSCRRLILKGEFAFIAFFLLCS